MNNEFPMLLLELVLGVVLIAFIFVIPGPFQIEEVRLDIYDGTDIILDASYAGASLEIKTNNLALADRKAYVKRLVDLIDEIRKANNGEKDDFR